jgi:hypothetical protein
MKPPSEATYRRLYESESYKKKLKKEQKIARKIYHLTALEAMKLLKKYKKRV